MKAIAINKHRSKLKGWNVEMPNAPHYALLKRNNPLLTKNINL